MVNETATVVGGNTDIVAIILLGILAVALLTTLFFVIKIYYTRYVRNSVRFNIIMPDNKIVKKRLKNVDKSVMINDVRYIFDDKSIVQFKNNKEIFYFYKHPQPIVFDRKKINPNSLSSTDVANIIDEEYSRKLFSTVGLDKKDMLMIVVIVGIAVLLVYMFYTGQEGVVLKDTADNRALIESVIRGVIGGR